MRIASAITLNGNEPATIINTLVTPMMPAGIIHQRCIPLDFFFSVAGNNVALLFCFFKAFSTS